MYKNYLTGLTILVFILICSTCYAVSDKSEFTRDELKRGFDIVAQNFGALQFAYYTFTLEFERPPNDIQELTDSGHFMVKLKNPYSDKDVYLGAINDKPYPAGLYYSKFDELSGEFAAFFINPNKPSKLRSLKSRVTIFTHEALKEMVFGDDASREEQLTKIYLIQLNDAIDSFEQRYGRLPKSLDEMSEIGDVNVSYINPFTKKPVKNTDKLSAGDYMYRKFTKGEDEKSETNTGSDSDEKFMYDRFKTVVKRSTPKNIDDNDLSDDDEYYEVIGWGKEEPVYYFSTDTTREYFGWGSTPEEDSDDS